MTRPDTTEPSSESRQAVPYIDHLDIYVPRHSANATQTDTGIRNRLLALKRGEPAALEHYIETLDHHLGETDAIACVPSHIQGLAPSGIRTVAQVLASRQRRRDVTRLLLRTRTVRPLHCHGDRSPQLQRTSLAVDTHQLQEVGERRIVLLDDIATTGTSLTVARDLLLQCGAWHVALHALAQTIQRHPHPNPEDTSPGRP